MKWKCKGILIVGLAVLLTASLQTQAQDPQPTFNLAISPANPTSESLVTLALSGTWPDDCIPADVTSFVAGNNIEITMVLPGAIDCNLPAPECQPIATGYSFHLNVGPLAPGLYAVTGRIVDCESSKIVPLGSFTVSLAAGGPGDGEPPVPLPTFNLAISPANPTSESLVKFALSGTWPDDCIPADVTSFVAGNNIEITMVLPSAIDCNLPVPECQSIATGYSFDLNVGPLAPGLYAVTGRIVDCGTSKIVPLGSFTVSLAAGGPGDGEPPVPLPAFNLAISPANPTSESLVTLALSGTWPDDCTPADVTPFVAGNNIEITMVLPSAIDCNLPAAECQPIVTRSQSSLNVGPLAPGLYTVTGRIVGCDSSEIVPLGSFTVSLAAGGPGDGEPPVPLPTFDLAISPANPTSESLVTLALSGTWPDDCTPADVTPFVAGNNIEITMVLPGAIDCNLPAPECQPIATGYSFDLNVGPLTPGTYTVTGRIVDCDTSKIVPLGSFTVGLGAGGGNGSLCPNDRLTVSFGTTGVRLTRDPQCPATPRDFSGCTTVTIQANFRAELSLQVIPLPGVTGTWTGTFTPNIVEPGETTVEVCVNASDVDLSDVPAGQEVQVATVGVLAVPAP